MPTINERRLDSLAKILECNSKCVAISCIDNKFLISANEFNSHTCEDGKQFVLIKNIMNHFKKIANDEAVDVNQREALIQDICIARLSSMGKGSLRLSPSVIEKFINSQRLITSINPTILECRAFKGETNVYAKVSAAFSDMQRIYRNISKIESGIKKARTENFEEISEEQLTAFKNFDSSQIIRSESSRGTGKTVHAEMQVLGNLLEKNKQSASYYIGISKLCCINCQCVLDAANEILAEDSEKKVVISNRGAHLGDFSKNWGKADFFTKSNIGKKIYSSYISKIETMGAEDQFNLEATDSESEPSQTVTDKQSIYRIALETKEKIFNEIKEGIDKPISEHLRLIKIGVALNADGMFADLFDITDETNEDEVSKIAGNFLVKLHDKYIADKNDCKLLINFLKSSHLPLVRQRDKIVNILVIALQRKLEKGFEPKQETILTGANVEGVFEYLECDNERPYITGVTEVVHAQQQGQLAELKEEFSIQQSPTKPRI